MASASVSMDQQPLEDVNSKEHRKSMFRVDPADWNLMSSERVEEFHAHERECFELSKRVLAAWALYSSDEFSEEKRSFAHSNAAKCYVRQVLELECTTSMSEEDLAAAVSVNVPPELRSTDDFAHRAARNI